MQTKGLDGDTTRLQTTFSEEFIARLRIKWVVLRTAIEERLAYRGDFVFSTLVRFLPIVTQLFMWNSIYGETLPNRCEATPIRIWSRITFWGCWLEHSRVCQACRPGLHSRLRTDGSQVSDTAGRHAGPFVLAPHCTQTGVLCDCSRTVYSGVLDVPIVPAGLAGRAPAGRIHPVIAHVVSGRIPDRSPDRTDRLLVPRSEFPDLHLHDAQLYPVGTYDPT